MTDHEVPHNDSQRDLSIWKDLEPTDARTLIEMYAYKYTKGVLIGPFDYITAEQTKSIGETCRISAPLNTDDRSFPLQMTFHLPRGRFRFYIYPDGIVHNETPDNPQPEELWLKHLEEFFGPLGLGEGLRNFYESGIYRASVNEPFHSISSGGSDYGYGMGKTSSQPKFYPGYKHELYGKLFDNKGDGERGTPNKDQARDAEAESLAAKQAKLFPDTSADLIKDVIAIILNARRQKLTDRTIFYALAREFHPDSRGSSDSRTEQIIRLLNALYDKVDRKFSVDN